MILVKICGIREPEHALAAAEAGADFIGLVFAESPRRLTLEQAQAITGALGGKLSGWGRAALELRFHPGPADPSGWLRHYCRGIETLLEHKRPLLVGVFADAEAESINAAADAVGLDLVQLSGHEPWDICQNLSRPVIKAVRVRQEMSAVEVLRSLRPGAVPLLDTYSEDRLGGSGQTFDWRLAQVVAARLPIILAGGLTAENVAEAIRLVQPWAVDVSSGVETQGLKDVAKIQAFIAAAKGAD